MDATGTGSQRVRATVRALATALYALGLVGCSSSGQAPSHPPPGTWKVCGKALIKVSAGLPRIESPSPQPASTGSPPPLDSVLPQPASQDDPTIGYQSSVILTHKCSSGYIVRVDPLEPLRTIAVVRDVKGRILAMTLGLLRKYTTANVQPLITEYADGRELGVVRVSF